MFYRRPGAAGTRLRSAVLLRARVVERGATAVEYAIMAALIAGVVSITVLFLGVEVNALFTIPGGVLDGTP